MILYKKLDKLDLNSIEQLVLNRYLTKNLHPSGELFIYNYTDKTAYDNYWNDETLQCRGLITDKEGNIVARPFAKFFNLEAYQGNLPIGTFDVYEKLDGSLGILYFYNNMPFIATKGTFVSPQAQRANEMLYSIYKESIALLDKNLTYLFEIVYPENRIVVNYGDQAFLTLLAVIETESGKELPLNDFSHLGFPLVERIDQLKDMETIIKLNENNREGFVIHFASGLRIKFKFEDYVKLHSIITQVTKKKIWKVLKENKSFDEFIENIPDELFKWIKNTESSLREEYKKIEEEAWLDLKKVLAPYRKDIAMAIQKYKHIHVMFSMLDNKDFSKYIWGILEPEHEIPSIEGLHFYKNNDEE